MGFDKRPLSFEELSDLLIQRGMQGDQEFIMRKIRDVSYYRLSGYWRMFQNRDDTFRENTQFSDVWAYYTFDRRLRLLILDAIERFEISLRNAISHTISHTTGEFSYVDPTFYHGFSNYGFEKMIKTLKKSYTDSKEVFILNFQEKHGTEHELPPIWMMVEIMTFGSLVIMYEKMDYLLQKQVSDYFGVSPMILRSWLLNIRLVRNICAHHSRLWNKEFGIRPLMPRSHHLPIFHNPFTIDNRRMYGIISVFLYILDEVAKSSEWKYRLKELLSTKDYEKFLKHMGFPRGWNEHQLWDF